MYIDICIHILVYIYYIYIDICIHILIFINTTGMSDRKIRRYIREVLSVFLSDNQLVLKPTVRIRLNLAQDIPTKHNRPTIVHNVHL
jgi:hypothetical protein